MAIELIVQHIRDFLNNRGRGIDNEPHASGAQPSSSAALQANGKKSNEPNTNNMHRLH